MIVGALLFTACMPAGTLAVAEMLPTTLDGEALVEGPDVDTTTGELGQLVGRLGKTSADVEAAARSVPDDRPSKAFVRGVRIAGVDGARLLDEETALIREILGRDAQAEITAEVISIGGKPVTRLASPVGKRPIYLLVSLDTIFLIGNADESEADELIRRIP